MYRWFWPQFILPNCKRAFNIEQNQLLSCYLAWRQPTLKKKDVFIGAIVLNLPILEHKYQLYHLLTLDAYSDKFVHYEIWKTPASGWSLSKGQLLWDITLCLVVVVFFATCLCWLIWLMHQKTCLEGNDCSIQGCK